MEPLEGVQTLRAALMERKWLRFPKSGRPWPDLGEMGTEAAVFWNMMAPLPQSPLPHVHPTTPSSPTS